MEAYIFQGFLVTLAVGGIALIFKWLLGELSRHVDRLEKQWEKYTDRLTEAMKQVHQDVGSIRSELRSHIIDEEEKRSGHTERLSGEISRIREMLHVARGGGEW